LKSNGAVSSDKRGIQTVTKKSLVAATFHECMMIQLNAYDIE